MKKRFVLLGFFLLISPCMSYSMEEYKDPGIDSPDQYHLTRYAVEQGSVSKDADLEQWHKKEEKIRDEPEGPYGALLEALAEALSNNGDLSKEHENLMIRSLTGVNLDNVIKKCK